MISRLNHVNVFVLDQDRAKAFYTETLGFELRNDAVLDGFRWLTVGPKDQKDMDILLAYPAPPMFSGEDAESVRALVAKGSLGGGVFETPDCRKTFEELSLFPPQLFPAAPQWSYYARAWHYSDVVPFGQFFLRKPSGSPQIGNNFSKDDVRVAHLIIISG